MKEEIYETALKKICSMMHDHDYYPPPSPDFMSDTHQLEECCRIAGEALDRVRGKKKTCVLKNCIHEGKETCRVRGVPVEGITKCDKYEEKKEK